MSKYPGYLGGLLKQFGIVNAFGKVWGIKKKKPKLPQVKCITGIYCTKYCTMLDRSSILLRIEKQILKYCTNNYVITHSWKCLCRLWTKISCPMPYRAILIFIKFTKHLRMNNKCKYKWWAKNWRTMTHAGIERGNDCCCDSKKCMLIWLPALSIFDLIIQTYMSLKYH